MWMLRIESQNNLDCHLRPMDGQNYSKKKWMFTFRFFFIYLSLYLFMAVLSLHCCVGFSLVAVSWGCSLAAESGLLIAMASLAVERGLQGTWASVVVTWDLSSYSSWTPRHRLNRGSVTEHMFSMLLNQQYILNKVYLKEAHLRQRKLFLIGWWKCHWRLMKNLILYFP